MGEPGAATQVARTVPQTGKRKLSDALSDALSDGGSADEGPQWHLDLTKVQRARRTTSTRLVAHSMPEPNSHCTNEVTCPGRIMELGYAVYLLVRTTDRAQPPTTNYVKGTEEVSI